MFRRPPSSTLFPYPTLFRSYAMLCYAMLCYAMLCYAMLCYAMLCMVCMLCYHVLCYAMPGLRGRQLLAQQRRLAQLLAVHGARLLDFALREGW